MGMNTRVFNTTQGIVVATAAGVLAWAGIVGAVFGMVA